MTPIVIGVDLRDGNVADQLFYSSDKRCSIVPEEGGIWKIKINPHAGGDEYPVCLQFDASVPIAGVGFAETKADLGCHTQKGSCGGCFSLEADLCPPNTLTPSILDDPPCIDPPTHYHFELYFQDGNKLVGFDPRIYNEGVGEEPWPRLLWCLVRRFRAWLRSFFRK